MISRGTARFWELYRLLPPEAKAAARKTYQKFRQNSAHRGLHGRASLTVSPLSEWTRVAQNVNNNRFETDIIRRRDSDWTHLEVDFNSGDRSTAVINLHHAARGESFFDDVRVVELLPIDDSDTVLAGDARRGEQLFHQHPAGCVLCHAVNGQGRAVGPPLDGIASRFTPAYLRESLLEPGKAIAKGYEHFQVSPMPPVADIFKPQEIADLEAYLQTLK